jgi:hypothetical protein
MEELFSYVENHGYNDIYKEPIEGLVFKRRDGQFSFKVINNKFLEEKK